LHKLREISFDNSFGGRSDNPGGLVNGYRVKDPVSFYPVDGRPFNNSGDKSVYFPHFERPFFGSVDGKKDFFGELKDNKSARELPSVGGGSSELRFGLF
jgi:hypothetical protein